MKHQRLPTFDKVSGTAHYYMTVVTHPEVSTGLEGAACA